MTTSGSTSSAPRKGRGPDAADAADAPAPPPLEAVLSALVGSDPGGVVVRDHRGEVVESNDAALPFLEDEGSETRVVSVHAVDTEAGRWTVTRIRDVDESQTLSRLQREAATDPLTQVGNRRLLAWLVSSMTDPEEPIVVFIVDLDDFKSINDRLGHDVGDQVLIDVADRLQGAVRPGDTVVRLGGDEFAVILRDIGDDDARAIRRRLGQALRAPYATSAGVFGVEASMGATSGRAADHWALLRAADNRMYVAKRSHRGCDTADLDPVSAGDPIAT